ncbi:uncharacterized protein LOC131932187 isoform X3 [Physella acuta]|uniref:uncharacterized protein LOC131932187 isoform X3 n=1 Tax=Physella acuta TaxID=109671 RepID=UPI0027DB227C|nr:uncharacterized protein LOC131932187 isoform X3 [Physella acuta]
MIITTNQALILRDVDGQHQDDHRSGGTAYQMPPQNLNTPTQQQQQHPDQHQMSQSLVDQHTGVSMADQHSSLDHAHSMAEHAAHSMLDLSETGSSLEHLAGGGHSAQSLADLGRGSDQSLDSNARRQQLHDRIGLNDGGQGMRQLGNDRDIGMGSGNNNGMRPMSGLGDRINQPMRNMTPVGDSRVQHLGNSMSSDGRGSVGLSGGNGNGLSDQGYPEQSSQSLLDSMSSRGRPPSMGGGGQHNLDQQHGGHSLPPHMRGEHPSHSHPGLVDHHSQQAMGGDSSNHNGRGGMSAYGLDNNNGQLHSRPGSTLLQEPNSRNDARDLSRAVYSSSSSSTDRSSGHQSTSLIEETIAAVASNLNKSSPDGGLMPGPLPPNSMMGHLGALGLARSNSAAPHMGHGSDESLADLVGRHHSHGIPMLSERASQSLSGLMDDHSIGASSSGHGQGRELEKTHPCLTCLKMFRSKQQLAQHNLVHTGVRKHICSFCDRAFKQLSHLQQHVRIHTGERKYMCKFCERGFKQLSHLQKHTRIHTGEKPYRCKFENCERAFAQLSNLQHHMRNHDDQVKKEATRIHKCQICHRCYTNESSLKSHTLKMHIHIKPIDQHPLPTPKKRRKRKNKDLYGGAPTMVPVSSSSDGNFNNVMQGMKAGGSRTRSPTSSDDDEIIFVGEQMGPPRVDNFGGPGGGLGGQGQMLQGPGGRGHDLSHQLQFTGMGNFSRGADPLALLASANRFTLQDNMMSSLGGPLNSFSDQLAFRDAALLNSRFGDLRGVPGQGSSFDDRFSSGNFNQQQQQQQRDRDGFGNHNDINSRANSASNSDSNMQAQNGNANENRNQIPAHNQGMIRGSGMGGLGGSLGGMMHGSGQGGLGGLMKQIKQEPLDYFPSSCHGGDQFSGMGVNSGGGFLSPQHLINSHLRGQLPSLNVPLIRDHFSQHQMLPHSSASPVTSSTSVTNVAPSSTPSSLPSSTPSSLASLPLPLSHMGLYHQSHFSSTQRMGGLHPSPASTPSSQLSVGGANLPSNLSTQGGRSPLEQEDLRCFSPLRN